MGASSPPRWASRWRTPFSRSRNAPGTPATSPKRGRLISSHSQPLLPGFEKVLRPAIIKILDNPLTAAKLCDALLAAQALQHDTDLFFGREFPPRHAADVLHDLFRRFLHRPGFLSHLRSLKGYDEPEI